MKVTEASRTHAPIKLQRLPPRDSIKLIKKVDYL
jgi:hypothetical protein